MDKAIFLIHLFLFLLSSFSLGKIYSQEIIKTDTIIKQQEISKGNILTYGSIMVDGVIKGDAASISGDIIIRGKAQGNAVSIGGKIFNSGEINGDMVAIASQIESSGYVSGNILNIGGTIKLKTGSKTDGNLIVIAGAIEKDEGALVLGKTTLIEIKSVRLISSYISKITKRQNDENRKNSILIFGILSLVLLFTFSLIFSAILIIILPFIFFRRNVENVKSYILQNIWTSFWTGTIILICLVPLILIMIVSIIGIFLIPIFLILLLIVFILGFSSFSIILTEKFFEGIKKNPPQSLIYRGLIGYFILITLLLSGGIIPFIGWIIAIICFILITIGTVLGLGAAWQTRLGTKKIEVQGDL